LFPDARRPAGDSPDPILRESLTTQPREATVPITQEDKAAKAREMLADLYRLVEALDRRVPHIERIGEAQIAHEAADLRERAVSLIQRIEGKTPME
jgi:hypothetical protein